MAAPSLVCRLTAAAAAAKLLHSCPTLCDSIDGSSPGSPVPGILQARTLEWVAVSLSKAWKWKVKVKSLSHVRFLATPWTAAYQAPLSMGFSRQEYWSEVPLPSPADSLIFIYNLPHSSTLSNLSLEQNLVSFMCNFMQSFIQRVGFVWKLDTVMQILRDWYRDLGICKPHFPCSFAIWLIKFYQQEVLGAD